MTFALTGARIFDGEGFLDNHTVVIDGRHIARIVPDGTTAAAPLLDLRGGLLAPGFIDIQVNGGGGALLNKPPTVDCVRTIAAAHRRHGVTGILPTVITDAPGVTRAAIAAVRAAQESDSGILGIHVEGPFLDPVRKGAHAEEFIRPCTDEDVAELARHGCGRLLLTLAPNRVPPAMIRSLVAAGLLVSLGHSDASADQCLAAVEAGASCFTHLFNAMSQMTGKEGGMVGAALASHTAYFGLIIDGHHVNEAALRAVIAARPDHAIMISDAMPSAAGGPDAFELQGRTVTRRAGRLTLADGTLAGSDTTMDASLRFCVRRLGLPLARALRLASLNPARFLGRRDLGRIVPGALASLVRLDDDLNVTHTWVEGK